MFIFFIPFLYAVKIESTGALPPEVLFTEAVKILEDKCERLIAELSWFFLSKTKEMDLYIISLYLEVTNFCNIWEFMFYFSFE